MRTIRKRASRRRQRDVLCDVMLSAGACESWLTLDELAKLPHLPARKHLRAIAPLAKARIRCIRRGKAAAENGTGIARGELRRGLGVSAHALDPKRPHPPAEFADWLPASISLGGKLNGDCVCGGSTMSVKPEMVFDVCWEVYRGAREVLETKRGISALY